MRAEDYMRRALELAARAAEAGDVPVGCVVVKDGRIVGEGYNRRQARGDATAHAELEAIRDACARLGRWRLNDCEMYVTLEPCPMCAGGIINARLAELHYGTKDEKAGACASVIDLFQERFNHRPRVYPGLLERECAEQLQAFFQQLREEK